MEGNRHYVVAGELHKRDYNVFHKIKQRNSQKKQKTKNKIKGMIMKEVSGKKRSQPEEIESKDRASFVVVFAQQSN